MSEAYNYIRFLDDVNSFGENVIDSKIFEYAFNLPDTYNKNEIIPYFEKAFENGSISEKKDRLVECIKCLDKKLSAINTSKHDDAIKTFCNFRDNIKALISIIDNVGSKKTPQKDEDDLSAKATSLKSYDEKVKEIQKRLEPLEKKVERYEDHLNDKLFSLIINTVAILGIFVAVAFAGFGANTLFSKIQFDASKNMVNNVFYLFLIALFVYNLLFLLFYCIFKIIERLSSKENDKFRNNHKVFLIIDAIGFGITILLFIYTKK